MYKPVFRKTKLFDGSTLIDIGDCEDPNFGLMEVHFGVCIKPEAAMMIFLNHHTKERIVFIGSSRVSRVMQLSQYSYDVYYIRGTQDDYKVKKGVHFTDPSKGTNYKQFLTKALLRAVEELEKEYGTNWLTF